MTTKPFALIFSGAGMSADSGLPTFRDADGLWEGYKPEDVAEHEAYFRDRETVLRFYAERYVKYNACQPHEGHFALARLEEKYDVQHVTQNVDDLLEKAGCSQVVHFHGSMGFKKCERHVNIPVLQGDRRFRCDYRAPMDGPIQLGDLCPKCSRQLRPDIVLFNECVSVTEAEMEGWVERIGEDGVFICCGTSLTVYPAALFVTMCAHREHAYIVDKKPPKAVGNYKIYEGSAAEQLPLLVEKLLA